LRFHGIVAERRLDDVAFPSARCSLVMTGHTLVPNAQFAATVHIVLDDFGGRLGRAVPCKAHMIAVTEIEKKKAPISIAVIRRINRKLAAKGQILKARHSWAKLKRYYILDLSGNVMDADIDPLELARKFGVLKEGEEVKPEKNHGGKVSTGR
jgi:hypothetical protein